MSRPGGEPAAFEPHAREYDQLVEHSIRFAGRGHDFFLEAKAHVLLDLARRHLGDPATLRALDVGCGPGRFDRFLEGTLASLEGVDPSEQMVEHARRENPWAAYRVADGTALPHDDDAFDLGFASCVLHHVALDERHAFLRELARVLRPGGLAVVFEHNPFNPLTRLAVSRCAFDEDAVLLRRRELMRRVGDSGLRAVEGRYILFLPWRGFGALERGLAQVPLGAQYYVAATA